MKKLFKVINPLQRMGNSFGMDQTFLILKKNFKEMKIHEFKPGSKAGEWTVPSNWKLNYSYLKDENNNILADSNKSILFVSPNSKKINKIIDGKKLLEKTISLKNMPDVYILNHKHTYNFFLRQKDWGISLPYNIAKKISKKKKYFISINSELSNSSMKVGELFIKGKIDKTICISAHIDELCNDNLSGCIAAIELYKKLKKRKNLFNYQVLLFPELYGPLYYISRFPKIISKTLFMINLETVGAGKKWCLKKCLKSNSFLENCLRSSFKKNKSKFKEMNFFDGYINDEKVYAWPKVDIPGVAIQRHPYKYYHTSKDTLDKINFNFINESIKISKDMINIFEKKYNIIQKNYIPKVISKLPPWLTKRKLYISQKNSIFPQNKKNNLFNERLLFSIDGKNSLYKICNSLDINFQEAYIYLQKFVDHGIIKKIKINGKDLFY
jgi:aminopeptidase-like protein